ncbi:MAG: citrate lyase acyl carrier protein [Ezakiella sp.]
MERKIVTEARAGTYEINYLLVSIKPNDEKINLEIRSVVSDMFYNSIEKTVLEELEELGVKSCNISIDDRGALPFAIKARVRTAVMRGSKDEL